MKDYVAVIKTEEYKKEVKNCIDCPFHSVKRDPDPHDWFCDDDMKVVCTKKNKDITTACRPYNLRRESEVPKWCPLIKKTKKRASKIGK